MCAAFVVFAAPLVAQDPALPILKTNCQPCHSDNLKSSGLSIANREALLTGGNRGAAIKPGSPADSLLVRAMEQSGDLKMPPGRKLNDDQIAVVRNWIAGGAQWPQESSSTKRKGADWWAFQPIRRADPPAVKQTSWVRNPIDQFVLGRLEKEKLK